MDCSTSPQPPVEGSCPKRAVLEQFLLGLIVGQEADRLERHLLDCRRCTIAMETISAKDTLVEEVRAGGPVDGPSEGPSIRPLMDRLRKLPDTIPGSHAAQGSSGVVEDLAAFLEPPEQPDELGRLGPYRVTRILGSGGMGVVFEAEDPQLRRRVALKALRPVLAASESARKRFLREARAAAAVEHDNVVTIYRVDEHRGLPYLAMPLLKGESLAERLSRTGKLPPGEVVRIACQIAAGLAAAHRQGVVHRDVKPDNVWLEEEPNEGRVKILDFGLARVADDDLLRTRPGLIAGTPAYMAPEQAEDGEVDERADLFSLGCVLYETCTGRPPFSGSTAAAILLAVVGDQPPAPHTVDRGVPRPLSDLITRLLEKAPPKRPQTAEDVYDSLGRLPERPQTAARVPRRRSILVALAAAFLGVSILAGTVVYLTTREDAVSVRVDQTRGHLTVDGRETDGSAESQVLAAGAPDAFRALAISRDDSLLLSGGGDKTVRLLDMETGGEIGRFPGHTDAVVTVDTSPDGKLALSAGRDGDVRIWDLQQGSEKLSLVGHAQRVTRAVFSPDGGRVLSGSLDGTVRLWNTETGDLLQAFTTHTSWVRCVAFSPDGRFIVSGSNDATALVWDLDEKRLAHVLQGHQAPVSDVEFAPDGRLAVTVGFDATIRVWDLQGEREIRVLRLPPESGRRVAVVPGSLRVLVDGPDNTVDLWDLKSSRRVERLVGHTNPVQDIVVSADGTYALSAAHDGTVRRWRLPRPPPGEAVGLSADHLQPPALPPVLDPGRDGESVASIRRFQGHADAVRCVALSRDASMAISGGNDAAVRLWDVSSGRELKRCEGHADDVLAVAFLNDGKRAVSGGKDATLRIWDLNTAEQAASLEGHAAWVTSVVATPDGSRVLSGSLDRTIRVWDAESGDPLKTLGGTFGWVRAVAMLPDATRVVSGGNDGNLVLWDAPAGKPLAQIGDLLSMFVVTSLAVSPDGARVVVGDWGGSLHMWDLRSGRRLLHLDAHLGTVHDVAFLPHGRYVVSGGRDGRARLWDTQEGRALYHMSEHSDSVTAVAVSPDGRFALTGSKDNTLRLWPLPPSLGQLPEDVEKNG